jgi:APA family basic amino acid/polyamine antiporter
MNSLFRRKPLELLVRETERPEHQLKRTLGPVQLTALGIGALVGAGIFSTVGTAAAGGADHLGAGPALVLSCLLVAVVCCFAALCYAKFTAMVPVSGSASGAPWRSPFSSSGRVIHEVFWRLASGVRRSSSSVWPKAPT